MDLSVRSTGRRNFVKQRLSKYRSAAQIGPHERVFWESNLGRSCRFRRWGAFLMKLAAVDPLLAAAP
jgi:hypothetical protein